MPEPGVLTPVPVEELKQRRFGRVLTKMGKVTRDDVQVALTAQQTTHKGKKLGQILLESGKITELAVRDVVHGRVVKNKEALANPEALDLYEDLPELRT